MYKRIEKIIIKQFFFFFCSVFLKISIKLTMNNIDNEKYKVLSVLCEKKSNGPNPISPNEVLSDTVK
jgi:hypothetical protein